MSGASITTLASIRVSKASSGWQQSPTNHALNFFANLVENLEVSDMIQDYYGSNPLRCLTLLCHLIAVQIDSTNRKSNPGILWATTPSNQLLRYQADRFCYKNRVTRNLLAAGDTVVNNATPRRFLSRDTFNLHVVAAVKNKDLDAIIRCQLPSHMYDTFDRLCRECQVPKGAEGKLIEGGMILCARARLSEAYSFRMNPGTISMPTSHKETMGALDCELWPRPTSRIEYRKRVAKYFAWNDWGIQTLKAMKEGIEDDLHKHIFDLASLWLRADIIATLNCTDRPESDNDTTIETILTVTNTDTTDVTISAALASVQRTFVALSEQPQDTSPEANQNIILPLYMLCRFGIFTSEAASYYLRLRSQLQTKLEKYWDETNTKEKKAMQKDINAFVASVSPTKQAGSRGSMHLAKAKEAKE
jgi:hypothetical protein